MGWLKIVIMLQLKAFTWSH